MDFGGQRPIRNSNAALLWSAYGAWADESHDAMGQQYYNWNGAWGYMHFPLDRNSSLNRDFNFNLHDELDIGLYYVHGRWYNQDTGLYLSPDDKGSYIYFDNDPVNQHAVPRTLLNDLPSECMGGMTNYDPRDLTCWLFREMKHNLDDPRLQALKQTTSTSHSHLYSGIVIADVGLRIPPVPFVSSLPRLMAAVTAGTEIGIMIGWEKQSHCALALSVTTMLNTLCLETSIMDLYPKKVDILIWKHKVGRLLLRFVTRRISLIQKILSTSLTKGEAMCTLARLGGRF